MDAILLEAWTTFLEQQPYSSTYFMGTDSYERENWATEELYGHTSESSRPATKPVISPSTNIMPLLGVLTPLVTQQTLDLEDAGFPASVRSRVLSILSRALLC